ncbi:neprilysin-2-like [Microplitis mediator]|uniref:neprilysin-2-like n=1 Tax=Microplitis mediator TaxID=375433 RepID=UPI00255625FD|nr:neprilysin-2-like [Microplitis mediator]
MERKLFDNEKSKRFSQTRWPIFEYKLFLLAIGVVCLVTPANASLGIVLRDVATNKCTSDACNLERTEIAAEIAKYQDTSINPCDNFFRFVCGNYKKPENLDIENFDKPLKRIQVENLIKESDGSSIPYKLVDDLYKTCMNENAIGEQSVTLIKNHINNLCSWSTFRFDESAEVKFDWIEFSGNAKKAGYNINFFLDFKPEPTYKHRNSSLRYSIHMAPFYFDYVVPLNTTEQKQIYVKFLTNVTRLLGEDVSGIVQEIYDFENKLSEITSPKSRYQTEDISIEKLNKQWPSIDWNRFVDKLLMPFVDDGEKPTLTIWNTTALTKFVKLIEETPKNVQAHYAVWKIIQYSVPFMNYKFRLEQQMFYNQIGHPIESRKVYCDYIVKKYAGTAVQYLYLNQYRGSQDTIRSMTDSIKKEMIKIMEKSESLNDEDRKEGVEILKKMGVTIGPTGLLSNPKALETFYADAIVVKYNYLQTILNLNVFKIKKELSNKIHKEWFQYFVRKANHLGFPTNYADNLYIPMNMIQSSLFDNNRPMYMNFGASGSSIAREMFMSLLHLGTNWTEEGKELPTAQLECFQRSVESVTKVTFNTFIDRQFIEQSIAQHIGFLATYAAYKDYVAKLGPELKLPQLPYKPEQLFWISHAHSFCIISDNPNQERIYEENQFNKLEYTMKKIYSNIPEFSTDFQCSVGSNMNPKNKCTWW